MAEVTYADLERALNDRDPQFVDLVIGYLAQPDPPETGPEDADDEAPGQRSERAPLPEGTWTMGKLRMSVAPATLLDKAASERKAARKEAWEGIQAALHHPLRLDLGDRFIALYQSGDVWAHEALMQIFKLARLGWGVWRAFKRIYKLAEERHDAAMFGVLAYRLDAWSTHQTTGEIMPGTIKYMRRRPWRYLRQLGRAVPDLYPQFASQVLEHYPKGFAFWDSLTASHILAGSHDRLESRAFHEAWKIVPEPLLRLLEDAENDEVCDFAIRSLKADFPEKLRKVDAEWLARIGKKPLASVNNFIVGVLEDSPEFHQSKLRGLGLHEMVLGFLDSESDKVRAYAIEYARGHAPDMPVSSLVRLAAEGSKDVRTFVIDRLSKLTPAQIGLPSLLMLVGVNEASAMAEEKIRLGFSVDHLTEDHFITLSVGNPAQRKFVTAFFKNAEKQIPAKFYTALLDDPRCDWMARRDALEELGKRTGREIGAEWIKKALMDPQLQWMVSNWLRSGKLSGPDLDVEWVKGLVMRPSLRNLAIEILRNRALVAPSSIGLAWLLAMARQPDENLHQFAHRYLLEHFSPEDFALEKPSDRSSVLSHPSSSLSATDIAAGIDRLWSLASGAKEPEQVRTFAATYLKVHHPELGPTLQESRSLGIKPKLPLEAYALHRVRPRFFDERADVRRLAAAIGRQELVRWGDRSLLYDLCDSRFREGRAMASDALLAIGRPDADEKLVPPADWIDATRVFALAESSIKASREIALTLIRHHYAQIGGARRLAWLMESPDREVRLFAVRLLWDKHRPREVPEAWKPAKGKKEGIGTAERFDSVDALRMFLRTVMFGLPPGRMERREAAGDALPDRALPASVAKQRLLDVVRDLSVEDETFARIALPVLEEFMHSQAKGEWQGCVAALARIRKAHPSIETSLPPAVETRF